MSVTIQNTHFPMSLGLLVSLILAYDDTTFVFSLSFNYFLRFNFFLRFWSQPIVDNGGVSRGRVCGCYADTQHVTQPPPPGTLSPKKVLLDPLKTKYF